MTANLHLYSAYKPSGVPWLGDVPEHWEVGRLKGHATNVVDLTRELGRDDIYLGLEHVESWTGRFAAAGDDVGFDSRVKRFKVGDVLLGKLRPYLAKVACPDWSGVCVGEFLVLRPSIANLSPRYLDQLMRSKPVIDAIDASTFGAKMPRADWLFIGDMRLPLPPLPEQAAIVRYLDHVDERIRRYVSGKQKLIRLLEEEKQAIIHRAVTRGLDPNVRLKPSGVEWLGDVPEHWKVRRLKQVSWIQGGFAFSTDSFGNEGVPVVRMNNIRRGVLDLDNVVRIPEHKCKDAFALNEGDIIYGLSGSIGATGSLGNYAVVRNGDTPAQLNQRIARFRPSIDRITEEFLVGSLQTSVFYEQVLSHTTGTAQFNVSTNDIGNVALVLPPVEEQRRIVCHLSTATADVDTAIASTRRQIELLREYRTRLIADVVTGQVDVREAAARLPEETDDQDPIDDGFPLTDDRGERP